MRFALCFLFNIQASPPEIQPLDDAIVFLRDHSENTTVSNVYIFSFVYRILALKHTTRNHFIRTKKTWTK